MKTQLKLIVTAILGAMFSFQAQADLALDTADDAVYNGGSITTGLNGGSGFLDWAISTSGTGGTFIGDSTAGAGDINTAGESFGLFGNPSGANSVNANRGFSSALVVGETFSVDLGVNFDNGNKGVDIFGGSQGSVFNFNVGSGASVSIQNGAVLNAGAGAGYDYGGNDAVIDFSITIDSASAFTYNISRVSSSGTQGTLFSGQVTGLTDAVSGFGLYNAGTDNGDAQNNLYFNNLQVVPEPSSLALILLGTAMLAYRRKK